MAVEGSHAILNAAFRGSKVVQRFSVVTIHYSTMTSEALQVLHTTVKFLKAGYRIIYGRWVQASDEFLPLLVDLEQRVVHRHLGHAQVTRDRARRTRVHALLHSRRSRTDGQQQLSDHLRPALISCGRIAVQLARNLHEVAVDARGGVRSCHGRRAALRVDTRGGRRSCRIAEHGVHHGHRRLHLGEQHRAAAIESRRQLLIEALELLVKVLDRCRDRRRRPVQLGDGLVAQCLGRGIKIRANIADGLRRARQNFIDLADEFDGLALQLNLRTGVLIKRRVQQSGDRRIGD